MSTRSIHTLISLFLFSTFVGALALVPATPSAYAALPDPRVMVTLPPSENGPRSVVQIAAWTDHTCAVANDGSAWCWGHNHWGQLGDGSTTDRPTPTPVSGLSNITAIAAGDAHTCAVTNDGRAWCWGYNLYGQLGDGTRTDSPIPVSVSGLSNITAIEAGNAHTCALLTDGRAWCWGTNYWGELGDGSTETDSPIPVPVSGLSNITAIVAGSYHTCAVTNDGRAWCWGTNWYGQLGDGTTTESLIPVQVSGLSNITAIEAGNAYTCAVTNDGSAWCWGYNLYGKLGDGSTTDRPTPTPVSGLSNITAIAAGYDHTCAVTNDGRAWCWGYNNWGQLGNGSTNGSLTPVPVSGLSNITAIAPGWSHTCALLGDGRAWCWGVNWYGQLGDGTTTESLTPVPVSGFTGDPNATYTLSGKVTTAGGQPIASVTLQLSNNQQTTTNNSGEYQFTNLPIGSYTVSAHHIGYIFDGPFTFMLNGNTTRNFTSTPIGAATYTLRGNVRTATGQPIAQVNISLSNNQQTTTNSNGEYQFTNLPSGTYTVRATFLGYTFNGPFTLTLNGNTTRNFTGTPNTAGRTPLILIPGIMGSKLADSSGTQLWPTPGEGIAKADRLAKLKNLNAPITATEIVEDVLGKQFYGPLIRYLEAQGYTRDKDLYIFAYDWRQDNVQTANDLAQFIETKIYQKHGVGQVDILAHSMGGLVGRQYLVNHPGTVRKFIAVATPWLGSPKVLFGLETGDQLLDVFGQAAVGLNQTDLRDMTRVFPGSHQLLPNAEYFRLVANPFWEIGWDYNGRNGTSNIYTYQDFVQALDARFTSSPGSTNRQFFDQLSSDWRTEPAGVEYLMIAGIGRGDDTIRQIKMTTKEVCKTLSLWDCTTVNHFHPEWGRGDQTVPSESASRVGNGEQLNAPQAKVMGFYPTLDQVEHTDMLSNRVVQNAIGDFLNGSSEAALPAEADADPPPPIPLNYLTVLGSATLDVTDATGATVGSSDPGSTAVLTTTDYYPLGDNAHMLVLPTDQNLTVTLRTGALPIMITLERGTSEETLDAVRYLDLSLPPNITATIRITPQGAEYLRYDADGNGSLETVITPTVSVSGPLANDTTAPTVTISLNLGQVTITAVDPEAGVQQLLYSLDGTTFQPYTGTFTVDPVLVPTVLAFADDQVGNRSGLARLVTGQRIYLPLIRR